MEGPKRGTLFIVSTPIGNLKDITLRALEVLSEVDLIVAEDTRRTRKLTSYYNIHKPLISYHEHSNLAKEEEIIARIKRGEKVAIVTDAGTPGLSDPGFRIIRRIIKENLELTVIPGPSAVLTALLLSGLPLVPFAFLGFPPSRGNARKTFFERYRDLPFTRILFESPHRLVETLEEIILSWQDPMLCVARELTKAFEEVVRGTASEVIEIFKNREEGIKGEITVVVEGARGSTSGNLDPLEQLDDLITQFTEENPRISTQELAKKISAITGIAKGKVYNHIIQTRRKGSLD
ncbi:MAG: 16S rRNA (cytidine(1402)-2'-O)-methyltransferase [Syntrophobacterales bacterium]|nr:16S rRNA (cytidine(1402)-2'-O)-methyltransferase [Syntrophobacterales bacterium]